MFMYILCVYKKTIILSLFKIDTLNFTMYILTILTSLLKIYVIGLHNLISMNIFSNIKFLLSNCKKTNELLKQKVNQKQPFEAVCNMHRKTPLLESLFSKPAGLKTCKFIKKKLQHFCFPVTFAKFLRTAFFIERLRWLRLNNYLQ